MPRVYRLNVHKPADHLVAIHHTRRLSTRNNFTEHAGVALVGHVA
jgi:hypothetical protein